MKNEGKGQSGVSKFNEIDPDYVLIPLVDAPLQEGLSRLPRPSTNAQGIKATISIFADNPHERAAIGDDLEGAGFQTRDGGPLDMFVHGPNCDLGDMVFVECTSLEGAGLAGLIRLDERLERQGGHLIVSTSMNDLEDVFSVVSFSDSQILVEASRSERIVAVGRAMAHLSENCVREMSGEDRLNLLYLSRQVESIAHTLEGLSNGPEFAECPAPLLLPNEQRNIAPPPEPQFVRRIISNRMARAEFFDKGLFADPAWDMLLDLTAAHGEDKRISVTSLCVAARVPATTALRWVKQLVDNGIFRRAADPSDKRRAFIELSDESLEAMSRYFKKIKDAGKYANEP